MDSSRTDQDAMEMSYTISNEDKMTLKLHDCIRNDEIFEAISLVQDLCQETRQKLTRANEEHGLKPAIFVAMEETWFSNTEFVEFLVDDCNADIEEKYESENTFDAASGKSPLEFAFSRGQFLIFDFLVIAGADPTSLLKDRMAIIGVCYSSFVSLRTVEIFADLGADFNVSDDRGVTCLMHSVRHVDRCQFLVHRGVDLNVQNNLGETALHIAAKTNRYESVKVLLENGADPYCKNNYGYDPLHLACMDCQEKIMLFMLETAFQDVNRQIESYQLLGISFLLYRKDIMKTLTAWKHAVALYVENRIQRSAATLNTPFGVAIEATSLPELDTMNRDHELVSMQSLVLTHKIFGPNHVMFFCSISLSAARYCQAGSFDKWIQMLTYCFQMIRDSSLAQREGCTEVRIILLGIDRSIRSLFERNTTLHYSLVYEFMKVVVQTVQKYNEFDEKWTLGGLMFTSMVPFFSVPFENSQRFEFQRLVRCAMATIHGHQNRTVLIDALSSWRNCGTSVATFPLLAAVTMLLDCGADVNERDQNDNNVVHFLYESRSSFFSLREIAVKCVEYGIHLDARNRTGMTTSECLQKLQIVKTPPINLMCIAARGIRKNEITVRRILPKLLTDFVEMH